MSYRPCCVHSVPQQVSDELCASVVVDTATVYSKGAEIIGVYKTILGTEGFKKGLALYFERFDGQAVTCDDFRQAMAGSFGPLSSHLTEWQGALNCVRCEL